MSEQPNWGTLGACAEAYRDAVEAARVAGAELFEAKQRIGELEARLQDAQKRVETCKQDLLTRATWGDNEQGPKP